MQTIASASLDRGVVEKQLERVLASSHFAETTRLKRFLRYLVERALAGDAESLKGYAIGIDVFDRPDDFDPSIDTIVRVQAGKLRTRLDLFYAGDGRDDPVRITIPKGSYAPVFEIALEPRAEAADPASSGSSDPRRRYSLAVLPFDNLSGDPQQEALADGFTEEVLAALARFRELQVVSRHSTFRYRGAPVDPRGVGEELGVRFVVQGSIRRWRDQLRVAVQLIETATGTQLAGETYDREISAQSLFDIQEDIASHVAAEIAEPHGVIHRIGSARRRAGTQALDAYECRLLASEYWRDPTPESHARVVGLLERAVTIDPGYAGAWAMLAIVYGDEVRGRLTLDRNTPPLDRALEAARRAIEIDPMNAAGHHALFVTHFHRHELASYRKASERALALNPNYPDLLADYGICMGFSGDWDGGLAHMKRALELSPHPPGWYRAFVALYHYMREDYALALTETEAVRLGAFFWGDLIRAMIHGQLGNDEEAGEYARSALAAVPDFESRAHEELGVWNFMPDDAARMIVGWQKAGLRISDQN